MTDDSYVRIIDFEDDEPKHVYCPRCEEMGLKSILGPKIILAGQQEEPNHDQ